MSNLSKDNINYLDEISWSEDILPNKTVIKKEHLQEIEAALNIIEEALEEHVEDINGTGHLVATSLAGGYLSKEQLKSINTLNSLVEKIKEDILKYSPSGIITAYDKNPSMIKNGYVWCNGSNNTPDTRGKIILGMKGKVEKEYLEPFKNGEFSDTINGTTITQKTVKATFQKKV